MNDPIVVLLYDLECNKKPSLEWIVRYSEGGMNPLSVAWENCREPVSMLRFLRRYDSRFYKRAIKAYDKNTKNRRGSPKFKTFEEYNERTCAAIRRNVLVLITLSELLESLKNE